jgi:hypothetical protein
LNSVTAPWKPGGALGGPGGGAVGSAGGVGMRPNTARHVPRPDRGHFEEMTTRDALRCTAACACTGRRCPRQWACARSSRHGAMRGERSEKPDGGGSERDGGDPNPGSPSNQPPRAALRIWSRA